MNVTSIDLTDDEMEEELGVMQKKLKQMEKELREC